MCGITGIFPLNTKCELDEHTRKKLILWFNTELLFHTIERGRDATGITVSLTEGEGEEEEHSFLCLKQPADATDFFENDGTEQKYRTQEENAAPLRVHHSILSNTDKFNFIIGHTRKKTQGSVYNVNNNHPIIVGNIIGIQNGGVNNDDRIFKLHDGEMDRIGEVDSEAIMQLLALDSNDKALDWDSINYVTQRMEGPRAVIAYNSKHPEKIIFFRDKERPIELYYLKELGAVLLCSKSLYMLDIKKAYQRLRITHPEFPKMSYETVTIMADDGGVIDIRKEYDSTKSLKDFLEVKSYNKKVIQEYSVEKVKPLSSVHTPPHGGYNQQGAHGVHNNMVDIAGGDPDDDAPFGHSAEATTTNKSASASKGKTTVLDHSIYDEDNVEEESIEEVDVAEDLIFGKFSEANLRNASFSLMQDDSKYLKEENTLFSRDENFENFFENTMCDKKHHGTIVSNLYPEIHADGFIAGVKFAEQTANDYVGALCDKIQTGYNEGEPKEDTDKTKKLEAKLTKASYMISNMKVFMMCLLQMPGMVNDVTEEKGDTSIEFSEDLEELITKAEQKLGLDMDRILRTFTNADYDALCEEASKSKIIG